MLRMKYTQTTGSFHQNAAQRATGMMIPHMVTSRLWASNFVSPPAEKMPQITVSLMQRAIQLAAQNTSIQARKSRVVSPVLKKFSIFAAPFARRFEFCLLKIPFALIILRKRIFKRE